MSVLETETLTAWRLSKIYKTIVFLLIIKQKLFKISSDGLYFLWYKYYIINFYKIQKFLMVAGTGFEPVSSGYEPDKEPLLYPAEYLHNWL